MSTTNQIPPFGVVGQLLVPAVKTVTIQYFHLQLEQYHHGAMRV